MSETPERMTGEEFAEMQEVELNAGEFLTIPERETEYVEGYGLVDADTGELITPDADIPAPYLIEEEPMTEKDVDWATSRIFDLDSEAVLAKARLDAELKAIKRNYEAEVKRLANKAGWFRGFIAPRLEKFAREVLTARNTKKDGTLKANPEKSVKFPKARLAFTPVNATKVSATDLRAYEERDAIEWVQKHYPHAIKMEPALDLAKLTEKDLETFDAVARGELSIEKAGWDRVTPLKVTPIGETFDVKTSVKVGE